jgi:hypothetical protein
MSVDAVLRNLEVLGEAATQIPRAVRERHPQVPWRRMAGLRDVLAHAYFGLEEDTIWQIIAESIPALAVQLDPVWFWAARQQGDPAVLPERDSDQRADARRRADCSGRRFCKTHATADVAIEVRWGR